MKKIEEQICKSFDAAIHNLGGEAKLSPIDRVAHHFLLFKAEYYYLNESCVFWYNHNQQRFSFSLRGYNTVTTRSRLRALLGYFCKFKLYMKNGELFVATTDGKKHKINANNCYAIDSNKHFSILE